MRHSKLYSGRHSTLGPLVPLLKYPVSNSIVTLDMANTRPFLIHDMPLTTWEGTLTFFTLRNYSLCRSLYQSVLLNMPVYNIMVPFFHLSPCQCWQIKKHPPIGFVLALLLGLSWAHPLRTLVLWRASLTYCLLVMCRDPKTGKTGDLKETLKLPLSTLLP